MTASDLIKKWIKTRKIENPNWGEIGGVFKNLMRGMSTDDIKYAINTYNRYYPNGNIFEFASLAKSLNRYKRKKERGDFGFKET